MRMKRSGRRGFTLIELLVVIAIIGILVAMTAAAVARFAGVGLAGATKTNVGKVHAKLNEQWKAVTDGANKDSLSAPMNGTFANAALLQSGGTSPGGGPGAGLGSIGTGGGSTANKPSGQAKQGSR